MAAWLIESRQRVGEADPPSAPTPEGEGASLSPVLTRKRRRSSNQPRNRRPLADLPSRKNWEDTPHMRGPPFPSRIRRYKFEPPSPPHHVIPENLQAPLQAARDTPPAIPPYNTTVSWRRRLVPRAGSPTYLVPRFVVHPSVHETIKGNAALCHSGPRAEHCEAHPSASWHWLSPAR